jgi:ribonucleotide monophosphatase NagD (HAD superfamily)
MERESMSKTAKLLTAFEAGRELTAKQIASTYKLANPHEAVRQLRGKGYCIYANDTKTGVKYRLGKPSRRMVAAAAMVAGGDIFSR